MVPTRRDALKQIAAAGIGCAVSPGVVWGQDASIAIAGRPVQIAIASVSPSTVRITISPLVSGVAQNLRPSGALVEAAAGRGLGSWREPFRPARAGDLSVRFVPGPFDSRTTASGAALAQGKPSIVIETRQGEPVQRLTLDPRRRRCRSARQGSAARLRRRRAAVRSQGPDVRERNGQGGYNCARTAAACRSSGWSSTDGWGMFIHQPLGAFDLTGARRHASTPADDAAADSTSSSSRRTIRRC